MKPRLLLPALAVGLSLGTPAAVQSQQSSVIALTGAEIIDGRGSAPMHDTTVVIDHGIIRQIGPAGSLQIPADAWRIDYRGKTILPGLISDHSHLGLVSGVTANPAADYTTANIERQLHQYVAYGVTTVTSLGVNRPLFYTLQSQLHAGTRPGADIFGADAGIGVPDGAPPFGSVASDQLYRPATAEQARADVRIMAAHHPSFIKLWVDDFHGSVKVKMDPAIYKAVIDEAHKHGLRVAAHVYYLADAKQLVADGVDVLAHGIRDRPVDAAFIKAARSRGLWYIPTLDLDESFYLFAAHPELLNSPLLAHALSPELKAQFENPAWRAKVLSDQKGIAIDKQALAVNMQNLKRLHDAGIKIGFGTDSGATPLRIPGFAEHRELALNVEAGLTPLQAITLATGQAAALLDLSDRGQIAVGKRADLLVVDGDPATDIGAIDHIEAVWQRGQPVASSLSAFTP
ncbi:amidohydrolase family protein [Frateuria aurantia]